MLSVATAAISVFMVLFNYLSKKPKIMWVAIGLISTTCVLGLGYEIFFNQDSSLFFMNGVDWDGH